MDAQPALNGPTGNPAATPDADVDALLSPVLCAGLDVVAMRTCGSTWDARDAVQETLARALAIIRTGRAPPAPEFPRYVHGILRHVIADLHRRRSPAATHAELRSPEPSALEQLVGEEQRARLQRALRRLGGAEQELLRRCVLEGEQIADIATASGEPAERLRKRKSRALQRLRVLLGERGHESVRSPIDSR